MRYHVGRDGQQFGQFTEQEIRDGLGSGRLLTSDLAWREGMAQWKPLVEVFGFAAAAALSAPMVSHGSPVVAPGGYPPSAVRVGQQHVGIPVMPTSGLSIASLVIGVLSLLSSLFTFLFCPFACVLAIPGVICGHMSLAEIRRAGSLMQGRGMAIAGLALNYAALAISIAFLLFFVIMIAIGASQEIGGSGAGSSP